MFSIDAQPPSAGVPQQVILGVGSVALWYDDGTTGNLRIVECPTCLGSGMRRRFGDDVSSAQRWAILCGFRFPEPSVARRRGMVVRAGERVESDAASGELGSKDGTEVAMEQPSTADMAC